MWHIIDNKYFEQFGNDTGIAVMSVFTLFAKMPSKNVYPFSCPAENPGNTVDSIICTVNNANDSGFYKICLIPTHFAG